MLHNLLLCLTPLLQPAGPIADHAPVTATAVPQNDAAEYEKRHKEAGDDADKLFALYEWCKAKKKDNEGKSCLQQILKLKPDHEKANTAIGNIKYDGKWFPSQKKVDEYKKEHEAKKPKEEPEKPGKEPEGKPGKEPEGKAGKEPEGKAGKEPEGKAGKEPEGKAGKEPEGKQPEGKAGKGDGLVDYKGQRVPAADVPFLERGMIKDELGNWVDAEELKKLKEGWVKQDFELISPDEKPQIEKGLWKCGDKWLTPEEADKYHSNIGQWWRLPFQHYTLYTTCDRRLANDRIKQSLASAWDDLSKIYGTEPKAPIIVVILRDTKQYGGYAAGDQDAGLQATESRALSSVHYAYFADQGKDPTTGEFMGAGVSYWDASTDAGNRFGNLSVRHALGQSYAEALDPSPRTLEKWKKLKKLDEKGFYEEKRLPEWYRYAAAGYAERYFVDTHADPGVSPRWAKDWSVAEVLRRGGLRPLKQLFEFKFTVEGGEDSDKMTNEVGLLMSFIMDGKCASVVEKNKAVQEALKTGKDKKAVTEAVNALEAEIIKHEADLRKFAGI